MGLAASQARYLSLTARKSDLEYQSQTINTRRIQLAYKTADIARKYSEGMNNQKIMYSFMSKSEDGKTTETWKELTFSSLLKQKCCLIGINGGPIQPQPYQIEEGGMETRTYLNLPEEGTNAPEYKIIKSDYSKLSAAEKALYEACEWEDDEHEKPKAYHLKGEITPEEYSALKGSNKLKAFYKQYTTPSYTVSHDSKAYSNNDEGFDIQSLLVSGQAQIVTLDFFNYLVANGYDYEKGLPVQVYQKLLDEWESETEGVNPDGADAVIDWRADTDSRFKQRNYTEDDADILAEYEAATAEIQAQDKVLEMEEKNIETQHKAIETEMEAVKKVIEKNMNETFKIFS